VGNSGLIRGFLRVFFDRLTEFSNVTGAPMLKRSGSRKSPMDFPASNPFGTRGAVESPAGSRRPWGSVPGRGVADWC
jgi:hypothetical protein